MNREVLRKKWNGMSAEILSDRVEWQAQHPMATFREIKAEVDKRLSELRAQMLSDAAMMNEEERWESGGEGEEEAEAANAGREGGGIGAGICRLSAGWARDFSPWMKRWGYCRGY